MEHLRIMFLRKQCSNFTLRLAAVALATTLASCSLNPFSKDDEPYSASSQSSSVSAAGSDPTAIYGGRVLERIGDPVPLAEGHPDEYVVQVGDTLWDIAATFLRDPWFWPEIWYVNPEIENPHLIYPGDVLGLVSVGGSERVTTLRGSAYRLTPQARITPLTEAVKSIPYESISAFLTTGVVLERREAKRLPYLVATRGEHLMAAAGNEIYVRRLKDGVPGTRYSIVHVGERLIDPDDHRLVGYQGIFVGKGTLRRAGNPATVWLTDTTREARVGDRLIPEATEISLNFFPKAPNSTIDGRIISVIGGVTQIGQYHVVVINRGARNGLATGDVLSVIQTGQVVADKVRGGRVRLPDEEAGTIMVFKVYDRIAYGLIMEATQPIHIHDAVRNPI
jgi:hypothetical protein